MTRRTTASPLAIWMGLSFDERMVVGLDAATGSSTEPRPKVALALRDGQRALFESLYREHFDFVFRNLRRLGIRDEQLDDAVQDCFMVVLRRLGDYRLGTSPKGWLFAIAVRVASNYRRRQRRKGGLLSLSEEHPSVEASPYQRAVVNDAARQLHAFLDSVSEDKRAVFIMAELERLSGPEIAAALNIKLNTVYSRLRLVRRDFVDRFAPMRETR